MTLEWNPDHTENVLADIMKERWRQVDKWGPQHHPDGTGAVSFWRDANFYKDRNDARERDDQEALWCDILLEELYEALSETDLDLLRAELVQVSAVATAWIEDIDGRN